MCPLARASRTGGSAEAAGDAEREPLVESGRLHLEQRAYVKALKAFGKALDLRPTDEEACRGKVVALRGLKRPRGALRACLVMLDLQPACQPVAALRDELLRELGSEADEVIADVAANPRKTAPSEPKAELALIPACDSDASTAALDDEPGRANSGDSKRNAVELKVQMARTAALEGDGAWLASLESAAHRHALKAQLTSFYRNFYKATSVKTVSTSQYSQAERSGLSIKDGHCHMPRPDHVEVPEDYRKPVGVQSAAGLAAFNCNAARLLLCVHGDLFDVSDRPDKYGPEGPYKSMAGHDITWALWSGRDDEKEWDKYFDLHKAKPVEERNRRFQGIMSWWAFFEQEYGSPVGRLDVYESEWALPPPPVVKDLCTLM